MRIALSGGEKGTYRNILKANNAPRIAFNITQFNVPKTKEVDLKDLLGGAEVVVYSSDGDEDTAKFDTFVRTHADNIELVIGRPDYDGSWLREKYVPLWNDVLDLERLAYLCERNGRVAISDRAITPKTLPRIRQLHERWGTKLVGITSKVDNITAVDWDYVIVSSWTSVVRYGETQVWDGFGLRRYPAQKKESARTKHRADIVRMHLDYEAVSDGDVAECAKLAVKSWMAWEEHTFQSQPGAYHPQSDSDETEFSTAETGEIATIYPETPTSTFPVSGGASIAIPPPESRHENEQLLLPVIGVENVIAHGTFTTPDGEETQDTEGFKVPVVRAANSSIRNCDSCYLAPRCPMFREHTECAYKIPVELKTKQQLQAVLTAMLEMQTSRVLFAKFAEELEGQGMDPNLSSEMDRLFKLVKELKEIEDTRDMVRIEMEARGSSGVLSRIFGDKAGEKASELSQPMSNAELDQWIINAEVLEENDG